MTLPTLYTRANGGHEGKRCTALATPYISSKRDNSKIPQSSFFLADSFAGSTDLAETIVRVKI